MESSGEANHFAPWCLSRLRALVLEQQFISRFPLSPCFALADVQRRKALPEKSSCSCCHMGPTKVHSDHFAIGQ
eukprot:5523748-Amphidinium_carterae.1